MKIGARPGVHSLRVMEDTLSGQLASILWRCFHTWCVCLDWKITFLLSVCIVELNETFSTGVMILDPSWLRSWVRQILKFGRDDQHFRN